MLRPVLRTLPLALPRIRAPLRRRIAVALREAVRSGRVRPGEPIPSTRDLARLWGVHRHTVMSALDDLAAEGWLEARRGAAYSVCKDLPDRFDGPVPVPAPAVEVGITDRPRRHAASGARKRGRAQRIESDRTAGGMPPSERAAPGMPGGPIEAFPWRIVRSPPVLGGAPPRPPEIRFQSGLADLRLFPFDELRGHVSHALRHRPATLLGYGDVAGHGPFREALAVYLRRSRGVTGRTLVVTHGSQEGIFLTAQALLGPGDVAAVEALGYPPAWHALEAAGATLAPLPVDRAGVDPAALEALARRRRVRLLYLTPLHQYPTTATLQVGRRMALMAIAARHGIPILEDDYDHEYHFHGPPLSPLAAADPCGLVIYATTLSKVLYPSARLGALALPPNLADAVLRIRRVVTRQNDTLLQEAVGRWIADGGFERHLRRTRRAYGLRLQALVRALEAARDGGHALEWRVPDGGMALWVRTPWSSARAAEAAAQEGIFVHPESMLRLDNGDGAHLRLGFASLSPEEIGRGVARLVECCGGLPAASAE